MPRRRSIVPSAALVLVCVTVLIAACSRTDSELQAAVDAELAIDAETGTLPLEVSVADGVVGLAGAVRTVAQQRRAVAIARAVDGVVTVRDDMHLENSVLVDAVKAALAADPLVGRVPITVTARQGTVELISDQTSEPDRVRAVEVASTVDGVKRVEDLMR